MVVIVVTAPIQNVGKTTLAMLITFLISTKMKVLAIDADMYRWTFTDRLGLKKNIERGEAGKGFKISELGYEFDFGFCDGRRAVELDDRYKAIVVDFDVSRSGKHAEYYLTNAHLIILPIPSKWAKIKTQDWTNEFKNEWKDMLKAKIVDYPIAVEYEANFLQELKWANPKMWKAMKKIPSLNAGTKRGIPYSDDWVNYINLRPYNKGGLKLFISESFKKIDSDVKLWDMKGMKK